MVSFAISSSRLFFLGLATTFDVLNCFLINIVELFTTLLRYEWALSCWLRGYIFLTLWPMACAKSFTNVLTGFLKFIWPIELFNLFRWLGIFTVFYWLVLLTCLKIISRILTLPSVFVTWLRTLSLTSLSASVSVMLLYLIRISAVWMGRLGGWSPYESSNFTCIGLDGYDGKLSVFS